MDRNAVYNWLKEQKGHVTIEELAANFRHLSAIEIAEGFNKFVNEQLDGR